MAKINGTSLLVYADGVLIAAQKSCTVSWEQDLPGATTKDSSGWEEHINGTRRASCDFDGLYSTTGLTADGLIAYITSRTNLLLLIDGGGFPIVGEATPKGVSISAVKEEAATISGSFKFDGPAWMLTGAYATVMSDPDGGSSTYDTMTVSGLSITSAIASGAAVVKSNAFAKVTNDVFKCIFFITRNSGALCDVSIQSDTLGVSSNVVTAIDGLNVMTLTCTKDTDGRLQFENTLAGNWSTSNIYLFKV